MIQRWEALLARQGLFGKERTPILHDYIFISQINMNKIMEETRVGAQPPKSERPRPEKGDKELASLIYDLENKQGETTTLKL